LSKFDHEVFLGFVLSYLQFFPDVVYIATNQLGQDLHKYISW